MILVITINRNIYYFYFLIVSKRDKQDIDEYCFLTPCKHFFSDGNQLIDKLLLNALFLSCVFRALDAVQI